MDSLQGQILVASPLLEDPNFQRSVSLMVEHDAGQGAVALVLNRPTPTSLRQAWLRVSELPCRHEEPLHLGGPCEGPLMVLHTVPELAQVEVLPGLYFSTDGEQVEQLVSEGAGPMRFFTGYAGWSPGQLEAELATGSWIPLPAEREEIFAGTTTQWTRLYDRAMNEPYLWPRIVPPNARVN
ncbi:MAG: YqgE/AlgH family protein [Phycisphaeraceae bacterium]